MLCNYCNSHSDTLVPVIWYLLLLAGWEHNIYFYSYTCTHTCIHIHPPTHPHLYMYVSPCSLFSSLPIHECTSLLISQHFPYTVLLATGSLSRVHGNAAGTVENVWECVRQVLLALRHTVEQCYICTLRSSAIDVLLATLSRLLLGTCC